MPVRLGALKAVRTAAATLLFSAVLAASAPALGQTAGLTDADAKAAANIRERVLRGTGAYDIVASLTTEIGHRLAGSEGDKAAVAWALNKLKELGFQNVRAQDVTVPHWVRGSVHVATTNPWPQTLTAEALGGSIGTPEDGIEADVVQVKDIETLRAMDRSRVEGRIVFLNKRSERTRDIRGYIGSVKGRTEGASVASSLGAAGIAIRSIGTGNTRLAHTGGVRYTADVPRIPAVSLSNPDADMLERQLASGRPVSLRMKLTSRELPPARSANVMGEIPGTGPNANEIVLIGAHLDSWDIGTGALDDGAGVAIAIEAARLIREMKLAPRRTVRVVLFANEEFGLSGGTAYAALPATEIARHIVAMEADLGAGPVWRFETKVSDATADKTQFIAKALQPLNIEAGGNNGDNGADIGPLRRLGVPVFELVHDATKYFDYHHTNNDTLDKVDPKALDQTVAAYAIAAYLSANMTGDFGRLPQAAK